MHPSRFIPAATILLGALGTLSAWAAQPRPAANEPEGQLILRDLDPASESRLNNRTRLEAYLAASYIFDLGSDAKNQEGWGGSIGLLALPPREPNSNWQLKFGGEFYGFSTSGDEYRGGVRHEESIDSGLLYLNLGGSYFFGEYFELGGLVGVGMGGSYGETKNPWHKSREGNWNYSLQFKPQAVVHFSENFSMHASYRLAYIGPFYQTDLIGYDTVRMLHQSVEIGVSWRF